MLIDQTFVKVLLMIAYYEHILKDSIIVLLHCLISVILACLHTKHAKLSDDNNSFHNTSEHALKEISRYENYHIY